MIPDFSRSTPAERTLLEGVWTILADGPLPIDELTTRCRAAGLLDSLVPDRFMDDDTAMDGIVMWAPGIWTSDDDVTRRLDHLMDGAIFTHRLTEREITSGAVKVEPDLTILDRDVEDFYRTLVLPEGGELEVFCIGPDGEMTEPTLRGPEGWLDGFSAGDLVVFVRGSEGQVTVERATDVGDGAEESEAINSYFLSRRRDKHAGFDMVPILVEVMMSNPALFRSPVAPISDLLEARGLESHRGLIGQVDGDWLHPGLVTALEKRAMIARTYGFSDCCEEAFNVALETWTDFSVDGTRSGDPRSVVTALGHSHVADAFGDWLFGMGGGSEVFEEYLTDLATRTGQRGAPALYLLSRTKLHNGDGPGAQAAARGAVDLDPDHLPATAMLGLFATISGDGREALRLLRRADPENLEVELLAKMFEPYEGTSRNDPCPCGSGRKYKVCCAVDPRPDGSQRTHWLTRKMFLFATLPERLDRIWILAQIAAEVDERNADVDLDTMPEDPFFLDLATFEVVGDFSDEWGPLLPQDERDIVDLWALSDLRLWEVTDAPADSLVQLRDTVTGDTVTVFDVLASEVLRQGDYILTRVAPSFGVDRMLTSPVRVDLRNRESLLELLDSSPTAADFAEWYGWVTALPRFTTTEGHDMVICTVRCQPTSTTWDEVEAALDAQHERDDDTTWHATFTNDKGQRMLRATMRREGNELVVETLSEERMRAVLEALPVMDINEESQFPVSSPRDIEAMAGDMGELEPPPPEVAEFLAEHMARLEDEWLDEQIPALQGLTPREAAADPTRREDLIALLNSFDGFGRQDGTFDVDRLRRELGLI
ncbi:MAG: SEC-C domain-containing protein [Actinomycetia bacterium]|nr:SEC-C domain-containing protein [Actinomycetes bacterium]